MKYVGWYDRAWGKDATSFDGVVREGSLRSWHLRWERRDEKDAFMQEERERSVNMKDYVWESLKFPVS